MEFESVSHTPTVFIIALFGLTLVAPLDAFADKANDFYIQQALAHYFVVPHDARSISLARSNEATCADPSCIYTNPAGLARITTSEGDLTVASEKRTGDEFLEHDSIHEFTNALYSVIAIPLGGSSERNEKGAVAPNGTLSFAYSRYQGKVNDRISTTPDGHRLTVGYGLGLDSLALGYSFTFYDDQLHTDISDLHSHSRLLHIFGFQKDLGGGLESGATFKLGIGQSDTEESSTHGNGLSHLRSYAGEVGLKQSFESFNLNCSVDYTHVRSRGDLMDVPTLVVIGSDERGDVLDTHFGGEYFLTPALAVRAGTHWLNISNYTFERDDLSDLSGQVRGIALASGAGYRFGSEASHGVSLNYGVDYTTVGHGGWQQAVTLTVPFE